MEKIESESKLLQFERRTQKLARTVFSVLFQENILLDTPRNHSPDFEQRVQDLMKKGEYWPVILGTHKSHSAGFPLIEEAAYVAEIANPYLPEDIQIDGSLLLVASTMEKGQNDTIVEGLKLAKPIFKKYNTETLMVLRNKDAKDLDAEEKREYQKRMIRHLGAVVVSGRIPLVLPEATVESGRQKPDGAPGEINGMVHLQPDTVAFLSQRIRKQRKEPLFIFVGTTGENRIYDPIAEKITREAVMTAVKRGLPLGKHFVPPIMSSVVGNPISLSELKEKFGENGVLRPEVLEQACGELLAQLLPPEERGVYAEPSLTDPLTGFPGRNTRSLFE